MGLTRRKPSGETHSALPSGSFTVDRDGRLIASTISSRFPQKMIEEIATLVLRSFAQGREKGLALSEFTVRFGAMNVRAVEMRGGAMIFLSPRGEHHKGIQTTP